MKRFVYLCLLYGFLFFVFLIALVFLRMPFGPYILMNWQDLLDLLTPLVLLPLSFLLYRLDTSVPLSTGGFVLFTIFAALWAMGHGMHLAANSINNLLISSGMDTGDVYSLTYFLDEYLSHYLWHAGVAGLSALIIFRQWKNPFKARSIVLWPQISGGIIYGVSYFLIVMEGNTAPLGVTFAAAALLFIMLRIRKKFLRLPLVVFFTAGYGLALVLFIIWAALWKGLPPIMDVISI